MWLSIYSLRKPVLRKEIQSVNLKTRVGELTILDHHRPLIVPVTRGSIKILDTQGEESILEASGGILEVRPENRVNILID